MAKTYAPGSRCSPRSPSSGTTRTRGWTAAAPLDDPDFEALLWQTAVGAWPLRRERLHAYAEKAAREAATSTTWERPNTAFERAMHDVIDTMFDNPETRASLDEFTARLTGPGWSNALGQKLVQLTMPGVPDVYQGTELWEDSLVDPDNRRPVDFAHRRKLLTRIDEGWLPPIDRDGAAKLLVTTRALRLRRDQPDLFTSYQPLMAHGPNAAHVLGFDRGGAMTIATRLPVALARAGGWHDTDVIPVPDGSWIDAISGRSFDGPSIPVADLLRTYPVALLTAR